jgi:hypothetical protein
MSSEKEGRGTITRKRRMASDTALATAADTAFRIPAFEYNFSWTIHNGSEIAERTLHEIFDRGLLLACMYVLAVTSRILLLIWRLW